MRTLLHSLVGRALAAALLAAALGAGGAAAEGEGESARAAYQKGLTEYNLGNYPDALKLFEEAYRIKAVPQLLFNIAQCHRQLGDFQRSVLAYRSYLRNAPPNDPNTKRAKELMAEVEEAARKQTAAQNRQPTGLATPPSPMGDPTPAGDSKTAATDAGKPAAKAAAGALVANDAAKDSAAKDAQAVADAAAKNAAASKAFEKETEAQAAAAKAAAEGLPKPAPKIKVVAVAEDPNAAAASKPGVRPAPVGSTSPAPAPRQSTESGGRLWTWVAGGAGVAALGGGTLFALKSKSAASDLQSTPHPRATIDSTQQSIKSDASTANLLFVVGGVLLVTAGIFFALDF